MPLKKRLKRLQNSLDKKMRQINQVCPKEKQEYINHWMNYKAKQVEMEMREEQRRLIEEKYKKKEKLMCRLETLEKQIQERAEREAKQEADRIQKAEKLIKIQEERIKKMEEERAAKKEAEKEKLAAEKKASEKAAKEEADKIKKEKAKKNLSPYEKKQQAELAFRVQDWFRKHSNCRHPPIPPAVLQQRIKV